MAAVSQSSPEAASSLDYEVIFDNALKAYEKKTGKNLTSDPLLRRLESCNSPDSVLALLKDQIPGFDQSRNCDEKLTKWVNPVVNVLCNFASTISGTVSLVSPGTF
jgi:fungal STAND N-terminal Goodbye domain